MHSLSAGNGQIPIASSPLLINPEEEEAGCCICFDDFDERDITKTPVYLRCGHVFHVYCLSEWEKNDRVSDSFFTCPLCRRGYKKKSMGFLESLISQIFGACLCPGAETELHFE